MSKTLIIAEKPSVAIDLARVLGVKKSGDHYENDRYVSRRQSVTSSKWFHQRERK